MYGAMIKSAEKIFLEGNGYARVRELILGGISRDYICRMKKDRVIVSIKQGIYLWNYNTDMKRDDIFNRCVEDDYSLITKIVPRGVMCLMSALAYYGLSDCIVNEYDVAIYREDSRPVIPEFLPVRLVFFSKNNYEYGITEASVDGNKFKIYDIEKTLCDCIRYRNKIGIRIVTGAFMEYFNRKVRDIDKLIYYSEVGKIKNVVENYLEMLAK